MSVPKGAAYDAMLDSLRAWIAAHADVGVTTRAARTHLRVAGWSLVTYDEVEVALRRIGQTQDAAGHWHAEAAVDAALAKINARRASLGQRPLDPTAAGWSPQDVIAEAQRLGNPATQLKRDLLAY